MNKNFFRPISLMGFLLALSLFFGAEGKDAEPSLKGSAETSQAKIRALLAELSAEDLKTREKIVQRILAMGAEARPAIVSAYRTTEDESLRLCLRRIQACIERILEVNIDQNGKALLQGQPLTRSKLRKAANRPAKENDIVAGTSIEGIDRTIAQLNALHEKGLDIEALGPVRVVIHADPNCAYNEILRFMMDCVFCGLGRISFGDLKVDFPANDDDVEWEVLDSKTGTSKKIPGPAKVSIFIRFDRKKSLASNSQTAGKGGARFYFRNRNALPVDDPERLSADLRASAKNENPRILIDFFNNEDGQDQLVPFRDVLNLIEVCTKAGIKKFTFSPPTSIPDSK